MAINRSETTDINKIKADYQKEIENNTVSLKRQLDKMIKTPIVVTGKRVIATFGEYERNGQRFPFTIADRKRSNAKYDGYIDVKSDNPTERIRKCQEVENNILSDGYIGYIEHTLYYDEESDLYDSTPIVFGLIRLFDKMRITEFDIKNVEFLEKQRSRSKKGRFVIVEGNEKVSTFYISDHEVTQFEYQTIIGKNPSYFKGDNKPVECVSWYDAIEFCNKLSLNEGLIPCYTIDKSHKDPNNKNSIDNKKWTVIWNKSANGYRLPTEIEWEYAAKGGNKSKGWSFSGSNYINDVGWYNNNSENKTWDVKEKIANELGIYDMSGNVWEWCWDWYDSVPSNVEKNYSGAISGWYRVYRGGSWNDNAYDCWGSIHHHGNPFFKGYSIGFRVVRNAR